jgi:serine/threonine protein phosphatase PrpC
MIRLESATLTNPGRERDINEDRAWAQIYAPSEGAPVGLFIVCDGIGGNLGGECASHWAVEAIKQEMADQFVPVNPRATVRLSDDEIQAVVEGKEATLLSSAAKMEGRLRQAIQKANRVVYQYAQEKPRQAADAGTTVTMAVVQGQRAVIANVGDSRTYILRNRKMRQITHDHSLVASMVASGQIRPEEIFVHPQRNVIYRSLGQKRQVQIDTFWETLQPGDHLLLCSDGLWEMVQDETVIAHLIESAKTPVLACQVLIDSANTAGGEDNIGVVVVRVS